METVHTHIEGFKEFKMILNRGFLLQDGSRE